MIKVLFKKARLSVLVLAAFAIGSANANADDATPPLSRQAVVQEYGAVFCRPPEPEALDWWTQQAIPAAELHGRLVTSAEGQRVRDVRYVYLTTLGRDPAGGDCPSLRGLVESELSGEAMRERLEASDEGKRVSVVRSAFRVVLGRDPLGDDNASLRRAVVSGETGQELRRRLAVQRPLVGVHYFPWYQNTETGWGNGATLVRPNVGKPAPGYYDSGDAAVVRRHIEQMETAGFDFVILNIPSQQPRLLTNTSVFFDELKGRRLKAAVMLDGLYQSDPAIKQQAVLDVVERYGGRAEYLTQDGLPVVYLFATPVDFHEPSAQVHNVYWSPGYAQGLNTFNEHAFLQAADVPFWSASPQPLINGVVPVMPGYTDKHLNRESSMEYSRKDGDLYRLQWERALKLRPSQVIVYSWNEYFEETAIEPTSAWGDLYLRLTSCYVNLAHQGVVGGCP